MRCLYCSTPEQQQRPDSPAAEPSGESPGLERTTSFEMPDEDAHAAEAALPVEIDMAEPSTALALKVCKLGAAI